MTQHALTIAGTNSGCGKTTITMGVMALLKKALYSVAPFKTGPDYIDPRFHEQVLGTPSYNLDTYMLASDVVKHLFWKHSRQKDIAVIEGVMGMYDGMGLDAKGSTYELSKTLNVPVVLVVGCKGLYQSVAAIVKGFAEMYPDSNVKGVILNHVSGQDHYRFLKQVVEQKCNVKCVGYVPPLKDIQLKSRHLGLIQAQEVESLQSKVALLTEVLADTIDLEALLAISEYNADVHEITDLGFSLGELRGLKLGVAYDEAFSFYYKDNLELLEECGAQLHYFSPLSDKQLPGGCNALYFGGGYPEVFAGKLSANLSMLNAVKQAAMEGVPVYAECGGLMYLTNEIIQRDGTCHQMTGVFDCSVQMTDRLKRFGYAELTCNDRTTRCHEFHCSEIVKQNTPIEEIYKLKKPNRDKNWTCGFKNKNTLAGYAHVHFWSEPEFTKQIFKLWNQVIM